EVHPAPFSAKRTGRVKRPGAATPKRRCSGGTVGSRMPRDTGAEGRRARRGASSVGEGNRRRRASGGRKRAGRTAGPRPSASAAPEVVDAELERDHRVRATHQRRLLANFEERGRLPVGEALADEQGEADGHL